MTAVALRSPTLPLCLRAGLAWQEESAEDWEAAVSQLGHSIDALDSLAPPERGTGPQR